MTVQEHDDLEQDITELQGIAELLSRNSGGLTEETAHEVGNMLRRSATTLLDDLPGAEPAEGDTP